MVIDLEKLKKGTAQEKKKPSQTPTKNFVQFLESLGTISNKDKIFFVQNLQVMIRSGLALDRSLKTLAEQTRNKRFKNIINDLALNTEKGQSFAQSLKEHEKVFDHLFISMVEAGEISGKLEDVLLQIYRQLKKLHELKNKVIAALIYPLIVVVAMVLIGIGMMIFVVPKITSLFEKMSAELPLATQILIKISNFIIHNGWLVFLVVFLLIFSVIFTLRKEKTKYYYHLIFLQLPIFKEIIKKINLAKFSRTLSSLLKTDISIVKSFEITAQILGNRLYRQSLLNSTESLKGGVTLTEVLKKHPQLYPPVIIQMVAAGEETGAVDVILEELANFYEDDVDQIMKTLPAVIEPLLILVLGAGVALMAVAIIMPMYSLTEHIK